MQDAAAGDRAAADALLPLVYSQLRAAAAMRGAPEAPEDLLALDEAHRRLEEKDARAAEVVRLRFFAALTVEQNLGNEFFTAPVETRMGICAGVAVAAA